jgi:CRP-like cAMP-binding protein
MATKRSAARAATPQVPRRNPNLLIAALPPEEYARVERSLDIVPVKLKQIQHKPREPIDYVYFPGDGFFSVLTVLEDGRMVEVATIGREGAVGVSAILDGSPAPSVSMIQAEISICYRMKAEAYRKEMDRRGAFYDIVTRYAQALLGFVMQSTACNAVHSVEQRLARWLLMARDRVERDEFPLTQEFVAMMLGASRPTVTVVAGSLQKNGLIKYHRGLVKILNGRALEQASCECYRAATDMVRSVTATASRPRPLR